MRCASRGDERIVERRTAHTASKKSVDNGESLEVVAARIDELIRGQLSWQVRRDPQAGPRQAGLMRSASRIAEANQFYNISATGLKRPGISSEILENPPCKPKQGGIYSRDPRPSSTCQIMHGRQQGPILILTFLGLPCDLFVRALMAETAVAARKEA